MAERGLRLRQGLEDVVNGQEERDALRGRDNGEDEEEEDEEEEDEIEYNARELRRLKPY